MIILHAGPPPSGALALLVLLALAASIFVTAAIISEFQRDTGPPAAKRAVRRRSQRGTPQPDS